MPDTTGPAVPVAYIDTETTCLSPAWRRPWDVAVIRDDPDGTTSVYRAYISDIDLTHAVVRSLEIGHFYQRHPRYSGRTPDQRYHTELLAMHQVEQLTRGAHIVGIVPDFDVVTLTQAYARHGMAWSAHYQLTDAEVVAAGRLGVGPPYDSDEIARGLDIAPPDPDLLHTAYGDAVWARSLHRAALGLDPTPPTDHRVV